MSFQTWHDYGYGIRVSRIPQPTVEQLEQLFALAPEASAKLKQEFGKNVVKNPTVEDYLGAECFWHSGLAGILAEVIQEVEGIEMLACDDFDGTEYLLYSPQYPWHMSDKDRTMTPCLSIRDNSKNAKKNAISQFKRNGVLFILYELLHVFLYFIYVNKLEL